MKHTKTVLLILLFLSACFCLLTSCAGNDAHPSMPTTVLKDDPTSVPVASQAAAAEPIIQPAPPVAEKPLPASGKVSASAQALPVAAAAGPLLSAPHSAPALYSTQLSTNPRLDRNFIGTGGWWPWILLLFLLLILGAWARRRWTQYQHDQVIAAEDSAWNGRRLLEFTSGLAGQKLLELDDIPNDKKILMKPIKKHRELVVQRARADQAALAKQVQSVHRLKLAKEAEVAAAEIAAKHAAQAPKGLLAKIAGLRHERLLAKRRKAYRALVLERAEAHQALLAKHERSARQLKLAKEAEEAAAVVAAKHAALAKKGLLAKVARARHRRLLAKRAAAHQRVLAEHDDLTHDLNLSKAAETVAPAIVVSKVSEAAMAAAVPVSSQAPEKPAEVTPAETAAKAPMLSGKTILPTDAEMANDEILVQGAGLAEVVKVTIKRGATFQEIIVSVARMGNFPAQNAHIFLEDEEVSLNPQQRMDAKHPRHKIHHVHTQKEIEVVVHFNGQEHGTHFSPATTVRKVLAWASHEFRIPDQDGREVFLSMPGSNDHLKDTAHIGRFVAHDQNKLDLNVMNPARV